jgi:hypothetical protein
MVCQRQSHNPVRLPCTFSGCKRWFKNSSGRTKHFRSCHTAYAELHRQPPLARTVNKTLSTEEIESDTDGIEMDDCGSPTRICSPQAPFTPPTIFHIPCSPDIPNPDSPLPSTQHISPGQSPNHKECRNTSLEQDSSASHGLNEPQLKEVFNHPFINGK